MKALGKVVPRSAGRKGKGGGKGTREKQEQRKINR